MSNVRRLFSPYSSYLPKPGWTQIFPCVFCVFDRRALYASELTRRRNKFPSLQFISFVWHHKFYNSKYILGNQLSWYWISACFVLLKRSEKASLWVVFEAALLLLIAYKINLCVNSSNASAAKYNHIKKGFSIEKSIYFDLISSLPRHRLEVDEKISNKNFINWFFN